MVHSRSEWTTLSMCRGEAAAVHSLPPQTIEVVASPGESWVLLGRDVLNSYRALLDGPQLAVEIG